MGLDMYVEGEKYFFGGWDKTNPRRKEDGYEVTEHKLELAYWRKHPDLHGFIVQNFANGVDECQRIELWPEDIDKIIKALRDNNLPVTSGFFFGNSEEFGDLEPDVREKDAKTWEKIKEWLLEKQEGVAKTVVYQASW